ncbi:SDR family oxidoreductase [Nocardioides sp.]|uniref:SDR family NAD(P)-dependent oxidoreductase n=1 Tax=Nocardioides sp. TaxID=35761 RepID=UPI0026069CFE|nr:SDR family oxidoreductase [Nocardioides sp.]MDI6912486.1 SDR family oxidoreductase [Nocardioides sp.]
MDLELAGKSVIVTGGASNIGRSIVLRFAAEGAKITLADLDVEAGKRVADAAVAAGAADVNVVRTDVTQYDEVQALMQSATSAFGTLDALVNNVGWDDMMYFTKTTPDFWQKVISINYVSVLNTSHLALQYMAEHGGGSIVSISSDASRMGEPREAVYGGTKAAVNSFMKTVAKENGRYGIRCNTVCPGVTVPESSEELSENSLWVNPLLDDQQLQKVAETLPLRKVGRPKDIANAVVFLSSQTAAGHITGQVLSVSGGYTMVG